MSKIFISYAWSDPPDDTQALCEAIEAEAARRDADTPDQPRFPTFRDRTNVRPGTRWRPEINAALSDCHGAVVILSPKALMSTWVRYELSIFCWRNSLNTAFSLVPVLLGTTSENLRTRELSPLNIGELAPIVSGSQSMEELACAILDRIGPRPFRQNTLEGIWLTRIQKSLQHIGDSDFRRNTLQHFDRDPDQIPDDLVNPDQLDNEIAAQLLFTSDCDRLRSALNDLSRGCHVEGLSHLQQIANHIKPNWIDLEAGARTLA